MNSLNSKQVENQLFFLAKESLKYIVLKSRCGITMPSSELKGKHLSHYDNNTSNSISPLLCIYKKSSLKLINIGGNLCFDNDSLKKEITIEANGLMTLGILELIDYYKKFKDIDNKKHTLSNLYLFTAKKQLEFYAANLRNLEGVFIDKKDVSKEDDKGMTFEEKNKKFKYSDQALLMAAYYRYSCFDEGSAGEEYRKFALDILNMFLHYKDELYLCSHEDILKICLSFNIFYRDSKLPEAKLLLLDFMEYLYDDKLDAVEAADYEDDLENTCLEFINYILIYENTGILKFRDIGKNIYDKLIELYEPERGIFIKRSEKKELTYTSSEISLYLLSVLSYMRLLEESKDGNIVAVDIFKRQLIDSGILLSWPASPDLDDVERYRNFTSKAEDLLDEQEFRMPVIPTPESAEIPSVFLKSVTYKKKKEAFSKGKDTFDSSKNMLIFFLIIYMNKFFSPPPKTQLEEE